MAEWFAQLRSYLSEAPSREGWWRIVALLEQWPEKERALAMEYVKAAFEDGSWFGFAVPSGAWKETSIGWKLSELRTVEVSSLPESKAVFCPPGAFWGGAREEDSEADDDEKPWREMQIEHGFYCLTTLVTQEWWELLMDNNPSACLGAKNPVEHVNWYDAIAFCNELSRCEGLEEAYILTEEEGTPGEKNYLGRVEWKGPENEGWRLPTETEWEFLCRAGSEDVRYGELEDVAWYEGNTEPEMTTQPVAQKKPNAWGLYDTLGNVFEWIWGCWNYQESNMYDGKSRVVERENMHVMLRGGSTFYASDDARASARVNCDTYYLYGDMGFRVIRSVVEKG